MKPTVPQLLRGATGRRPTTERPIRTAPSCSIQHEIRVSSLLKMLNSLYRPALSGIGGAIAAEPLPKGLLGRSQAVRQRILIPPFGGSIPPAPASLVSKCVLRLRRLDMGPECRFLGAAIGASPVGRDVGEGRAGRDRLL